MTSSKKYPFGEPLSKTEFTNRFEIKKKGGKIVLDNLDTKVWGEVNEDNLRDFCMFRLFDYSEALKIAEQQIVDMQKPEPFIPQDYGFSDLVITGKTYYSKGDCKIARMEDDEWIVQLSDEDTVIFLTMPDKQTAETVLSAMGIINLADHSDPVVYTLQDKTITEDEKDKILLIIGKELSEIDDMMANPDILEGAKETLEERKIFLRNETNKLFKNK